MRSAEIDARYRRYFKWCRDRGHHGWQSLVLSAQWRGEHGGPWVALEPNIVPYELEPDVEHWNLWYHPSTTLGTADLDLQRGAEVVVVEEDREPRQARIHEIRRTAGEVSYLVQFDSSEISVARHQDLRPGDSPARWAAVLRHVRLCLPEAQDDEVIIFQNIPKLRSVPEVAHAHVFIRPRTITTRNAVRELRRCWRLRSAWAEAERLMGRGAEVGFEE